MEVRCGAEEYTDEWHVEDAVVAEPGAGRRSGSFVPTPTAGAVLRRWRPPWVLRRLFIGRRGTVAPGGLYLRGMRPDGVLTSIEESAESDAAARESFRVRGSDPASGRSMARHLDVLS